MLSRSRRLGAERLTRMFSPLTAGLLSVFRRLFPILSQTAAVPATGAERGFCKIAGSTEESPDRATHDRF
jgi:hypothetical protein